MKSAMRVLKGQIEPPPRSTMFGAVLLICLLIFHASVLLHLHASLWFPATLLLLPLAILSRSIYTIHFNVFLVCFFLVTFFPHFSSYPFSELTLLLLYAYAVMLIPGLRGTVGWLRTGKFDGTTWLLIVATVVISCAALIAWVRLFSPDLARYADLIPHRPRWQILAYGIGFCTFNAALEEITWRGVMLEALDSAVGPGLGALVIQAASFAVAHYRNGFPNGIVGSLMVFAYGLMLGMIRRRSKGILACWLAHVAADFTIYCLVFYFIWHSAK